MKQRKPLATSLRPVVAGKPKGGWRRSGVSIWARNPAAAWRSRRRRRLRAVWPGQGPGVGSPREAADEHLEAPDGGVLAIARSIEGNAHDGAVEPSSCSASTLATCQVVVLNRNTLAAVGAGPRDGSRRAPGWRIMSDDEVAPVDRIHRQEIFDRLLARAINLQVPQVSDVLADDRVVRDHEREAVLEIGTHCKDRTPREACKRPRESAGTSGHHGLATADRDHRIIDAAGDGTLSHQEGVGQAVEALQGVIVPIRDRLAGMVRTRS